MISADGPRRKRPRAGVKPLLGSIAVHGTALAVAWTSTHRTPPPMFFESIEVNLVSMPAAEDRGSPVVETPDPAPPTPEPERAPAPPKAEPKVDKPTPKPEPKSTEKPTTAPPTTAPASPNRPAAAPRPTDSGPTTDKPTGSDTAEAINIRMEGLRRDYPVYYDNIILQIRRCFRWSGSQALEAELYFVIEKNGSVNDIRVLRPSINVSFDYEAEGAVECAGGKFGALPDDLPFDRLPIRFKFSPAGAGIFR